MPGRSGWKQAERMIAKDCGGQRIPVTGERHGSDVDHSLFAFQLKVRRALPAWLFDWLGGIVANATKRGKIGVLILNRPRQPRRNALVILRWQDWCDLHGTLSADARAQLIACESPEEGGQS
jgi:hypothetical protein